MNLIYFPFCRLMIEVCGIDGQETKYLHSTYIVSLFLIDNGYHILFLFIPICVLLLLLYVLLLVRLVCHASVIIFGGMV